MNSNFSTTGYRFSVPEKLYIVGQLELGLMTAAEAISQYDLSPKLLRAWRRWRHLHMTNKYKPRTVSKPKKSDVERIKELERLLKEKDKELKWQTLRADTLDRFIDISEEMLDIRIRKKAWYQTITEQLEASPLTGIKPLCRVFGLTRDAFYKAEEKTNYENLEHAIIIERVREIREDQPYPGTEKIYHLVKPFLLLNKIKMGRDKLDKLLKTYNLQSNRRKRRAGGTNSNHHFFKHPNLAKDKTPTRPNELFSSDITYVHRFNDFSYLSLITDCYSHKIVGWHLCKNLSTEGPLKALEMALLSRRNDKAAKLPLMHHSDRGIQYCSRAYTALLKKNKVTISMSRASYQNPVAERINGILKSELLRDGYPTHEEALAAITKAIDIYNNERPHRSIDMLTPAEAHKKTGPLKKRWRTNSRRRKSAEKKQKNLFNQDSESVEL